MAHWEALVATSTVRERICEFLAWGMHPTCKILPFLFLRQLGRYSSFASDTREMIQRLNLCAKGVLEKLDSKGQPNKKVQHWAARVIKSGWCHQLWPSYKVIHHGQMLKMDFSRGLPAGMYQEYFDACNDRKKKLEWSIERLADDTKRYRLTL